MHLILFKLSPCSGTSSKTEPPCRRRPSCRRWWFWEPHWPGQMTHPPEVWCLSAFSAARALSWSGELNTSWVKIQISTFYIYNLNQQKKNCTCIPHGAHANDAENEGEGEGSSHLLGDAPVPLLELLQRISPIIPIFIGEVKVQILQRMKKLVEDIGFSPETPGSPHFYANYCNKLECH